jgi:CHASE3 domain sensor protein
MGAPKYNEKPSGREFKPESKEEVQELSQRVNNLLKDPEKFKKAMQIIEQMINEDQDK